MKLRTYIENRIKRRLLRITSSPLTGYLLPFLPLHTNRNAYVVLKPPPHAPGATASDFPIPPPELHVGGYGDTAQQYLQYGQAHMQTMLGLLGAGGYTLQPGQRILDFGCADGRMTRWLAPHARECEIWGADISAARIVWCEQHLNPPFHFVATTALPHLPFEDRSFDLIYAGSVFTHIDDLAKTWLLELRRILRPGGYLYITVHDQHTIELLGSAARGGWLAQYLHAHAEYQDFIRQPFAMFTIGRALQSQVFYNIESLSAMLATIFRVVSVTPEAYAYQTAIVLQKQ